jgi:hypothetical protein
VHQRRSGSPAARHACRQRAALDLRYPGAAVLAGAAVRETVWTQSRPPGGPFDRIGPHRYRTHSVPADAAADTLGALRHWTSAVFVDDIASALDCVRATSGRDKVHVAGFSGGPSWPMRWRPCGPNIWRALLPIGSFPAHRAGCGIVSG